MAITNKDIEKLTGHFATKADLERFATKEDLKKLEDRVVKFEDKVVTRLDRVMGELERAREDRTFAKAKDDEQDTKIVELDKKLADHIKLPVH